MKWTWVSLVALVFTPGCGEPTCESTCQKVFFTCDFDYEEEGTTKESRADQCVAACKEAVDLPHREEEAVTWMQCVSTFDCAAHSDNGISLRAECPPDDYYVGNLSYEEE